MLKALTLGLLGALGLGLALAALGQARDSSQRSRVWSGLEAGRDPAPALFDPAEVADLPEVARRYFTRAIAPGTPLHRLVTLEMEGTFLLNGTPLPMRARQILSPPAGGFVWQARIGRGLMAFAGSDGYLEAPGGGESWTKFWLHGLVPLARAGGTADHARAAATRAMLESVWSPAALLPRFGAEWRQTGPNSAEIHFATAPDLPPMHLRLDAAGDPVEVWALRWSDANPDRTWRLQPFGGRLLAHEDHQGFRIPVAVDLGNHWGTPDYAPFFSATVTRAAW